MTELLHINNSVIFLFLWRYINLRTYLLTSSINQYKTLTIQKYCTVHTTSASDTTQSVIVSMCACHSHRWFNDLTAQSHTMWTCWGFLHPLLDTCQRCCQKWFSVSTFSVVINNLRLSGCESDYQTPKPTFQPSAGLTRFIAAFWLNQKSVKW